MKKIGYPDRLRGLATVSEHWQFKALLLAIITIVLFLRRPDVLLNPQPWAEDGQTFLQGVINSSYHSIFTTYAGYLHLIPRLTAYLSFQFGLVNAPLLMNLTALAITVFCISYFFNKDFRFIVKNDAVRFMVSIAIACMPIDEIWLNITNIQWFLNIYLILWSLSLIFNYNTAMNVTYKNILQCIFLILAFLSCPLGIILLPLLGFYTYKRIKDGSFLNLNFALVLLPILSLFLQVGISFLYGNNRIELIQPYNILAYFSNHNVSYLFYIASNFNTINVNLFWFILVSLLVIYVVASQSYKLGSFKLDALLFSLIFINLIIIFFARADPSDIYTVLQQRYFSGRFGLLPLTLLLFILVRNIEKYYTPDQNRSNDLTKQLSNLACIIFLLVFIINIAINLQITPMADMHYASYARNYDPNGAYTIQIPINPDGWNLTVPSNTNTTSGIPEISETQLNGQALIPTPLLNNISGLLIIIILCLAISIIISRDVISLRQDPGSSIIVVDWGLLANRSATFARKNTALLVVIELVLVLFIGVMLFAGKPIPGLNNADMDASNANLAVSYYFGDLNDTIAAYNNLTAYPGFNNTSVGSYRVWLDGYENRTHAFYIYYYVLKSNGESNQQFFNTSMIEKMGRDCSLYGGLVTQSVNKTKDYERIYYDWYWNNTPPASNR